MRVSRIEIFGFKSFMDRTILPLEGGLTGVVGPNGCGKSNIVDAVRWVLGETRAKSLRGANFEDVIFNGTDKLRPLGLAEVTITVKAKSESFFDEMIPALLNDDVAESLASVEEAEKEAENIVVKEDDPDKNGISNNKSNVIPFESLAKDDTEKVTTIIEDVDVELEEVMREANFCDLNSDNNENEIVSKVTQENKEEKKEEPNEKPQEKSMTLLSRFSWLKSTKEVQVTRRLYRSGESEYFINRVPSRLKDLKELFRAIGIGARAYTIVAQNEVTRIITAKPEEKRQMFEEAAGVLGFRDRISSANKRLEDTLVNVSRLDDIIKEVTRNVNSLKRQSHRARDRKGLLDRVKEVDLILFKDSYLSNLDTKSELDSKRSGLKEEEVIAKNAVDVIKVEEESLRLNMMELDSKGDGFRIKIDAIKEELNKRERKLLELKSRIKERQIKQESLESENERLKERQEMLLKRKDDVKVDFDDLEQKQNKLKEELKNVESSGDDELKKTSLLVEETRKNLNEKEREIKKINEQYISVKVRLESIEEQLISSSPISQLKKTLGNQALSDEFIKQAREAKLFIDEISIQSKYAKALQSVLGEKAEFLVSKDPKQLINSFIKMSVKSNKKGLGVGIFKEGEKEAQIQGNVDIPFSSILSLMDVKKEISLVTNKILKNVFVVETLDEGLKFFEDNQDKNLDEMCFVTLEGELLTSHSFYSLKHDGGLVQLKSKEEEYKVDFDRLSKELSIATNEKSSLFEDVKKAEFSYKQALEELRKRQQQIREISNKLSNIKGQFETQKRLTSQIDYDLERIKSQFLDIEKRSVLIRSEIENFSQELQDTESKDQSKLKEELYSFEKQYREINAYRNDKRNELSAFNSRLDEARKKYDSAMRTVNSFELDFQRVSIELENIEKNVIEKYSKEDFESFLSDDQIRLEDDKRIVLKEEIDKIRARIFREGDVDPTSIERYEEESVRLVELENQKQDLEKAVSILKKTITRLVETSQQRFIDVFEKVKENFSTLAPKLFGGGFADLELSDVNHPLESGVDIIARPPGKKLKSLELLSGGEKTLCAIALILATFLERPSPLCILDEVDAPLDEANLMRFLSLIKELSMKTQVIMITHNKQSMVASSNLIGVTMQEPGSTKLLSVSLEDAIKEAV